MLNIPHFKDFINSYSNFIHFSSFDKDEKFSLIDEEFISFNSDIISQKAFSSYLEKLDNDFFISDFRKLYYSVKQIRTRTIDTTFGSVSFNRRQYINKATGEYMYYIDREILKINSFQRLSNDLLLKVYYLVTDYSYQRVANMLKLSKQTIYNKIKFLRDFEIDSIHYPSSPKDIDILYIQADETYVPNQDKSITRSTMIKNITIHEGIENVSKGRNKLINKLQLTMYNGESNANFNERVYNTIIKLYNYNKLYLYGDGASWIKTLSDDLGATYILDLFHAGQSINRFCTIKHKEHIDPLQLLLANNLKSEFENYVNKYIGLNEINNNEFRQRNYKYLIKNWNNIQRNYSLEKSVGCSQEGINFHSFASRLTTLPKGFNGLNAQVIAQLICAKNNGKDFKKFIRRMIFKEKKTNNEINKNYSIKQSNIINQSKSPAIRNIINASILN